jgi:predicted ATP-grasp superfamily ATP-dependent carboligase
VEPGFSDGSELRPELNGVTVARGAPGVVLTAATALGTLAAVRCLGEHGVPVVVLDSRRFAAASWSRHVVHRELVPQVRPIAPFLSALIAFGARNPGHVLLATSDDLAWAIAQHEGILRESFRVVTPPFPTVVRVLDKSELYAACAEAGLAVPKTWFPVDKADVVHAAGAARFPVIVKPRAQTFFTSARKGVVVESSDELSEKYWRFALNNRFDSNVSRVRPEMAQPMIQELHDADPVYSVSGFCDPRRGLFVARGARKVLQWPRRAGVGVVFEDAPVDAALAEGVRRLCALTGFFGLFEAEFVRTGDEMQLIDFNPRLFNQVGFDVARGLPSPYFLYLLALGESSRLAAEVEAAQGWRADGRAVFEHGSMVACTRLAVRLGAPAHHEANDALRYREPGDATRVIEAAGDSYDWLPGLIDRVYQMARMIKHPRSTLRAAARGFG